MHDTDQLTDRIYEAGLVPELWPLLLSDLGTTIGGTGGFLFMLRDGYARVVCSEEVAHIADQFMGDGWNKRDPCLPRSIALGHAGFVNDNDLLSDDEIASNDVYRNFYRPHGVGYRAGTIIAIPNGDSVAIVLPRHQDLGPVVRSSIDFLDVLRPALGRAALTSNRMDLRRARAMADTLATLGLPGAVLRGRGKVYAANEPFEALMPGLFQDRHDRLKLANADADSLLHDALMRLPLAQDRSSVNSIPIAAKDDVPPMILHLLPIRGAAHDVFSQATALLVVTSIDRANVPNARMLQGLFDLTPAESRLAGLIGQAQSPREAAFGLGISEENARTTLKRIFSKTGTRRQAELVRLLSGPGIGSHEMK